MRYLYFDAVEDPTGVYEAVYDGLVNTPRGFEGPAENRTASKIFDKLEALGKPVERNGKPVYEYDASKGIGPVALEDTEFTLMLDALKVIRWTGFFVRKADALYAWLEGSPTELRKETVDGAEEAARTN